MKFIAWHHWCCMDPLPSLWASWTTQLSLHGARVLLPHQSRQELSTCPCFLRQPTIPMRRRDGTLLVQPTRGQLPGEAGTGNPSSCLGWSAARVEGPQCCATLDELPNWLGEWEECPHSIQDGYHTAHEILPGRGMVENNNSTIAVLPKTCSLSHPCNLASSTSSSINPLFFIYKRLLYDKHMEVLS